MSFIDVQLELDGKGQTAKIKNPVSNYNPSETVRNRIALIRSDMQQGYTIMQRPRREFNDLDLLTRMAVDQMSWSVYQPNDGDSLLGDEINGWRSQAVRPIVRNKVFSIAAHITARTIFPKIMAFDNDSQEQEDAATVMSDLMEWSTFNTNATYADASLRAVISALVNPVSIVFSQYVEVFRDVKREKNEDGTWKIERMLDEDLSGFTDEVVPPEQLFIQDFFQPDIQKQGWLIRRRVRPYTLARTLYGHYADFQYVKPQVQVIFNDANMQFYEAYDQTLHSDEVEEVLYWNKSLDLFLIAVNGVLLTDADNPNPREDKLYPFVSFGYEPLRPAGDCFYWKSLAFKTMPDDKIVNTLYPMIIDGTYLAIMPPMVSVGGETITSDVIVPGAVTTLADPSADLKPIVVQSENLKAGFDALFKVEQNISEDAFQPLMQGDMPDGGGNMPAYTMSKMETNAKLMLGPFLQMVGTYVKQMGRLRIGDIKQYLTLADATAIEGSANAELVYRTFLLPHKKGSSHSRRIKFTLQGMPDQPISPEEHLTHSYNVLNEEGGLDAKHKLFKVNPTIFRDLKYMVIVSPDVVAPMSEELEKAYNLELYDRLIMNPLADQEAALTKVLLPSYPVSRKHPDEFVSHNPGAGMPAPQPQTPQNHMQPPMSTGQQSNFGMRANNQNKPGGPFNKLQGIGH